jgi:hypothetical protein
MAATGRNTAAIAVAIAAVIVFSSLLSPSSSTWLSSLLLPSLLPLLSLPPFLLQLSCSWLLHVGQECRPHHRHCPCHHCHPCCRVVVLAVVAIVLAIVVIVLAIVVAIAVAINIAVALTAAISSAAVM